MTTPAADAQNTRRGPVPPPVGPVPVCLRGGYSEELHLIPHVDLSVKKVNHWGRFSLHRMGRETAHRITYLKPRTKSLIFCGRRAGSWGFYTDDGWVDWRSYKDA